MKTILIASCIMALTVSAEEKGPSAMPQVIQIREKLHTLVADNNWQIMNVENVGSEKAVQVIKVETNGMGGRFFDISFCHSFTNSPSKVLESVGVIVPPSWRQTIHKAGTFDSIEVPMQDVDKLPPFIHDLFVKLFKAPPDYKLMITLDKE